LIRDRQLLQHIYRRLIYPIAGFAAILIAGTIGYRMIGGAHTSLVDAVYMTFITVATIGYGEIVFTKGASCADPLQCNAATLQALRPY